MTQEVAVIGAGSWGTAFSILLAEKGRIVKLWCFEQEVADDITKYHENRRYLRDFSLDEKIKPITSLQDALEGVSWVFEAVPIKFLRSILEQAKPYVTGGQVWVILSKGIEQKTHLLPSQVIDDVFGEHTKKTVLSGPNFAKDFAEKTHTATTVASIDCEIAKQLAHLVASHYFRPYLSLDFIGVQVGGAIKNVIALLIGVAKGAKCSDNTIAYLLTRGLWEMAELAKYLGGKQETIYGLSGLGDVVLTSLGSAGRNQKVGMLIGQGMSLEEVVKTTGIVAEGLNTVQSIRQFIEKNNLKFPLCLGTYEIIFESKSIDNFLAELIKQPLTEEFQGG